MWFCPKCSTRNSVWFHTRIHIPCGSYSLFLHLNEHSRLSRALQPRTAQQADLAEALVKESSFSSREQYFLTDKLFRC